MTGFGNAEAWTASVYSIGMCRSLCVYVSATKRKQTLQAHVLVSQQIHNVLCAFCLVICNSCVQVVGLHVSITLCVVL